MKIKVALFVLGTSLCAVQGHAQAAPAATGPRLSAFAAGTAASVGERSDKAIGFTIGATYESPRLLGLEVRASAIRMKATYPQYLGTGGLRFTRHGSSLSEYAYVGGGLAHARYLTANRSNTPEWAPAFEGAAGVDWYFTGRFAWKVVDVSFGHIFTTQPLNPIYGSTGLIYHF